MQLLIFITFGKIHSSVLSKISVDGNFCSESETRDADSDKPDGKSGVKIVER